MSPLDFKSTKLGRAEARKQVAKIMAQYPEAVFFSKHAIQELMADDLTTVDALNVLKSPASRINQEGEWEKGSFRYRLETTNLMVVIAFQEDGKGLIVVTAWDKRRKGR